MTQDEYFKKLSVNDTGVTSNLKSSSALPAENKNMPVTVFSEQLQNLTKSLNISPEKLTELMNTPGFPEDPEAQVEFIKKALAQEEKLEVSTVKTEVEPEEIEPDSTQTETTSKESEPTQEATPQTFKFELGKSGADYDLKAFNNLTLEQKFVEYAKELLKNNKSFVNKDTDEELSPEEQNKLIEETVKKLKEDFKENGGILSSFEKKQDAVSFILDEKMYKLQAANFQGITVSKFEELPKEQQEEFYYDFNMFRIATLTNVDTVEIESIDELLKDVKQQFSKLELRKIESQSLLVASINHAHNEQNKNARGEINNDAEDKTLNDVKDAIGIIKEKKLDKNPAKCELDYLQAKKKKGETLSKFEQKRLATLKKLPAEVLEKYSSRYGEELVLEKSIKDSPEVYAKYEQASAEGQLAIKVNFALQEAKKEGADAYASHIQDAIECGDPELAIALVIAAKKDENLYAGILKKFPDSKELIAVVASLSEGKSRMVAASFRDAAKKNKEIQNDDKFVETVGSEIIKHANDEEAPDAAKSLVEIGNDNLTTNVGKNANSRQDVETAKAMHRVITDSNPSVEVKKAIATDAVLNSKDYNSEVVAETVDIYQENEPAVTQALIDIKAPTVVDSSIQTRVFKSLQANAEANMSKADAEKALCQLADQISYCHKSNQLDMHESIMQSSSETVKVRATQNIAKYDTDVQVKAIKVSIATGNKHVLEAVGKVLEKCPVETIIKLANDKSISAVLDEIASKKVAAALEEHESIKNKSKNINAAEERNERIEQYKAEFLNSSPVNRYNMIRKLTPEVQNTLYTYLAAYRPEIFMDIIAQKGSDLLKLAYLPEKLKLQIVEKMLRISSSQGTAIEYFKTNYSDFDEDLQIRCLEMMQSKMDPHFADFLDRMPEKIQKLFLSEKEYNEKFGNDLNDYATNPIYSEGGETASIASNRFYYSGKKQDYTSLWKRDYKDSNIYIA